NNVQSKSQENGLINEKPNQKATRANQKQELPLLVQVGERKRVVVITDTIENAKIISELNPDKTVWVATHPIKGEVVFKGFRVKPDVMLVSTKENQHEWVQENIKNASKHVRRIAHLYEPQS